MAVSESKRAANDRYDSKTYVQFNVRLRIEDDADIIESITAAHGSGINNREWLRELYEGSGVQMDRPGNYDALKAARDVGAKVLAAQSMVASKIEAFDPTAADSFPFRIYFVVKRLF